MKPSRSTVLDRFVTACGSSLITLKYKYQPLPPFNSSLQAARQAHSPYREDHIISKTRNQFFISPGTHIHPKCSSLSPPSPWPCWSSVLRLAPCPRSRLTPRSTSSTQAAAPTTRSLRSCRMSTALTVDVGRSAPAVRRSPRCTALAPVSKSFFYGHALYLHQTGVENALTRLCVSVLVTVYTDSSCSSGATAARTNSCVTGAWRSFSVDGCP